MDERRIRAGPVVVLAAAGSSEARIVEAVGAPRIPGIERASRGVVSLPGQVPFEYGVPGADDVAITVDRGPPGGGAGADCAGRVRQAPGLRGSGDRVAAGDRPRASPRRTGAEHPANRSRARGRAATTAQGPRGPTVGDRERAVRRPRAHRPAAGPGDCGAAARDRGCRSLPGGDASNRGSQRGKGACRYRGREPDHAAGLPAS